MKKVFVILGLSIILFLTGCSTRQTYYSKSEVKSFVKETFGSEYKLKEVNKGEDDTEEKNKMYEYVFKNDEGFEFSVYSKTAHASFDATTLNGIYEKVLQTNYLTAMINYKSNELNNIIKKLSFNVEVNSAYSHIDFYLTDYNQLEEAADAIIQIDKLFNFNYKYKSSIGSVWVQIHYNPSTSINGNVKNYVSNIKLSNDESSRLGYSVILVELKTKINNYVNSNNQ